MLFDRFAKLVGRGRPAGLWPAETALVDDARLFLFEEPVWGCRESYDSGQMTDLDDLRDHFRLPSIIPSPSSSPRSRASPASGSPACSSTTSRRGLRGSAPRRQCVVFMDTEG
jgi:hypothetical protein